MAKVDVTRVSIHAPAKEATRNSEQLKTRSFVSIHAPAKEATQSQQSAQGGQMGFNPRSREGSDTLYFKPRKLGGFGRDFANLENKVYHFTK